MDEPSLTPDELVWLQTYARDQQDLVAPLEVLARLEKLGLIMRGWNQTYVLTAQARALLQQQAD